MNKLLLKFFAVIFLILIIWVIHIFYFPHIVNWAMMGDDWRWLFYFDTHNANQIGNFFTIKYDLGAAPPVQQLYYMGILRNIFGLNQIAFQYTQLLFKSLAAFSAAFLVFKLTKNKIFAFFVVFFFIVFPSTAGSFWVISGSNYLIVAFMSFSIYFYLQSVKQRQKILLAALFFFLALASGPARAYLVAPVPFIVELVRLKKEFRPFIFLRRLLIFYFLPFVFLRSTGDQYQLNAMVGVFTRIKQLSSGNYYTLSLPFQIFSALFIDQSVLKEIAGIGKTVLSFVNPELAGFIIINTVLFIASIFLGFVIKGREKITAFVVKIMFWTIVLEAVFYVLAVLHSSTGTISFVDVEGNIYSRLDLNPTIFQASIGGYIFILGLLLALEWWKSQRESKVLMVASFSWIWSVFSILLLYSTKDWWSMIEFSNDRYFFSSSLGAVIFTAAIFALSFKALEKKLGFKILGFLLFGIFVILIAYKEYKVSDYLYHSFTQRYGGETSEWQEIMYQRFINKFGKENLKKPVLLFIDDGDNVKFNAESFVNPIRWRLFYDEKGNLIRGNNIDNCKAEVTGMENIKKSYTTYQGKKGFVYDYTICVNPVFSTNGKANLFYPLSNFYAYRMVNKEFVDIKDEILAKLDQNIK